MNNYLYKAGNNCELKKHINAIHCNNNLTLIQRKLFNALLFNAYTELPYKSQFEIPIRTLCNLIGYNSNDYKKLKNSLLALMSLAIEWDICEYGSSIKKETWRASSALASAKFEEGICTYEYSSVMRELLYQPDIYGRLDIGVLSKFKSSYGIALYENCIRFQGLKKTPWFTFEIFRKLMGVTEDKYVAFKDFKKRILNTAISEVNEHSPILISSEIQRKNQKVTAIRFNLASKITFNKVQRARNQNENGLAKILTGEFNLSIQLVNDLLAQYGEEYIKEKVDLIRNSDSFRLGKIRGLGGYLVEALKKDYKKTKSSKTIFEQKRLVKEKKEAEDKKLKENLERMEKMYDLYVFSCIDNYLKSLPKKELELIMIEFESSLAGFYLKSFKKEGLDNIPVKGIFSSFLKQKKLTTVMSKEEFIKEF